MVYDPNKDGQYWEYYERKKEERRKELVKYMVKPILTREEWLSEIYRDLEKH